MFILERLIRTDEERLKRGTVVSLTGRQVKMKWVPRGITQDVDFRSPATA